MTDIFPITGPQTNTATRPGCGLIGIIMGAIRVGDEWQIRRQCAVCVLTLIMLVSIISPCHMRTMSLDLLRGHIKVNMLSYFTLTH